MNKIFNILFLRQEEAIKNAHQIYKSFNGTSPAMSESSTTVYQLVQLLNKYV